MPHSEDKRSMMPHSENKRSMTPHSKNRRALMPRFKRITNHNGCGTTQSLSQQVDDAKSNRTREQHKVYSKLI